MKLNEFIEKNVLSDPEWAAAYEASQLRRESARMLARARLEQKLSQAQLAERCQTDQAVISRIERGVVSPSLDTLSRLAKGLGLRPVLHFERTTDAPPSGEPMPTSGVAATATVAQQRSRSPVRKPAPASNAARPRGAATPKARGDSGTSTERKPAT